MDNWSVIVDWFNSDGDISRVAPVKAIVDLKHHSLIMRWKGGYRDEGTYLCVYEWTYLLGRRSGSSARMLKVTLRSILVHKENPSYPCAIYQEKAIYLTLWYSETDASPSRVKTEKKWEARICFRVSYVIGIIFL